jgi:hypothetical protein
MGGTLVSSAAARLLYNTHPTRQISTNNMSHITVTPDAGSLQPRWMQQRLLESVFECTFCCYDHCYDHCYDQLYDQTDLSASNTCTRV